MKHARPDYDRIQDPAGLIPVDEPVFLLRAKDVLAVELVRMWSERYRAIPGHDPAMASAAWAQAHAMALWQQAHGRKVPDMPKDDATP